MEVEDIARKCFASGRTTQDERQLAIRRGLLGQIVVHAQRRLTFVVHEVFGHRCARVWRDVLHRRRIRRRRDDDDRVRHRALGLETRHDRRHGRGLLTDRHVHAGHALALLIDDRVDGDRRLPGATVADDELTLSAPDRDHRVHGLDAGLQGLLDGLADDDARRLRFDLSRELGLNRPVAVDWPSQCIDDAPHELRTDRHLEDATGAAHLVALLESEIIAEDDGADVVFFEVERETGDLFASLRGGDLEHLAGHRLAETVDASNSVLYLENGSNLFDVEVVKIGGRDLAKEDVLDFAGAESRVSGHAIRL